MEPQFKCAVFDVDGTLLDTSEGILASVRYTIEKMGLEPLSEEKIKTFIGPPIQNSFKKQYGFEDKIINEMAATFRNRYKDEDLLLAKPYDGIFKVLEELATQNITPAIATYKRQDYALKLLEHYGFNRYTDIIFGSDFEGKLTKKDIIMLALDKAGVSDYGKTVMIGDSDNDAIGANKLGTKFIGVTYGFGFKTADDVNEFDNIGVANTTEEIIKLCLGNL